MLTECRMRGIFLQVLSKGVVMSAGGDILARFDPSPLALLDIVFAGRLRSLSDAQAHVVHVIVRDRSVDAVQHEVALLRSACSTALDSLSRSDTPDSPLVTALGILFTATTNLSIELDRHQGREVPGNFGLPLVDRLLTAVGIEPQPAAARWVESELIPLELLVDAAANLRFVAGAPGCLDS